MIVQHATGPGPSDSGSAARTVLLASRDPAVVIDMRRVLASGADRYRLAGVIDPTIETTLLTWCYEVDVVLMDSEVLLRMMRRHAAGMREAMRRTRLVVLMREEHFLDVMVLLKDRIGILFLRRGETVTVDTVALAVDGYVGFPAPLLRRLVSNEVRREIAEGLSAGERTILGYLADARSNAVIASRTGLSEARVKSMVTQLIRKLHLHNRTALAVFAANDRISRAKG